MPAGDAIGGAHRHRAHLVLPDMLLHLGGQMDRNGAAGSSISRAL